MRNSLPKLGSHNDQTRLFSPATIARSLGFDSTWADDELRSTNAQIEMILTRALREAGRLPKAKPDPSSLNDSPQINLRPTAYNKRPLSHFATAIYLLRLLDDSKTFHRWLGL